jgi:hypothetical protein
VPRRDERRPLSRAGTAPTPGLDDQVLVRLVAWLHDLAPSAPHELSAVADGAPSSPPAWVPRDGSIPEPCSSEPAALSSARMTSQQTPPSQSQQPVTPKQKARRSRTSDHVRPCGPEAGRVVTDPAPSLH